MDKILKLSQAIRLGATFHPQCFRQMFLRNGQMEIIGTCALGAALEALGLERSGSLASDLKRFDLPAGTTAKIIELNDYSNWTREMIAGWLEGQGY